MSKRILLADDDNDDAELFQFVLEKVSADVRFTHLENGKSLFAHLKNSDNIPDIIFLDLNMPVMDGFLCLEKLKKMETCKDVDVYIYSTSSSDRDRRRATELGAVDFVTKPVNLDRLEKVLTNILIG